MTQSDGATENATATSVPQQARGGNGTSSDERDTINIMRAIAARDYELGLIDDHGDMRWRSYGATPDIISDGFIGWKYLPIGSAVGTAVAVALRSEQYGVNFVQKLDYPVVNLHPWNFVFLEWAIEIAIPKETR